MSLQEEGARGARGIRASEAATLLLGGEARRSCELQPCKRYRKSLARASMAQAEARDLALQLGALSACRTEGSRFLFKLAESLLNEVT